MMGILAAPLPAYTPSGVGIMLAAMPGPIAICACDPIGRRACGKLTRLPLPWGRYMFMFIGTATLLWERPSAAGCAALAVARLCWLDGSNGPRALIIAGD